MQDRNNILVVKDDSNNEQVVFEDNIESDDDNEIESEDHAEQTPYILIMSFGRQVLWHWNRRKKRIDHEYAIAWWALSVVNEVWKDVLAWMRGKGEHRDAIERVVHCLHVAPCANSNPDVFSMTPAEIDDKFDDKFWNEFKAFQNCNQPYHEPIR